VQAGRWLRRNTHRRRTCLEAEASQPGAGHAHRRRTVRTEPDTRKGHHLTSPTAGCRWRNGSAFRWAEETPPGHPSDCASPILIRLHGNPSKGRFENRFPLDAALNSAVNKHHPVNGETREFVPYFLESRLDPGGSVRTTGISAPKRVESIVTKGLELFAVRGRKRLSAVNRIWDASL
jgi:hypothetical protein